MKTILKLFTLSFIFLVIISIQTFSQANLIIEYESLDVCPDQIYNYSYSLDDYIDTCYSLLQTRTWTANGGTLLTNSDDSTAEVIWNENASYIQLHLGFPMTCGQHQFTTTESITVKSILSGTLSTLSVKDTSGETPPSMSMCEDETYWLETNAITEEVASSASSLKYRWYYKNGGGWHKFNETSGTTTTIQLDNLGLNPAYEIYFKVAAWSVCGSNKEESGVISKDLKYCFKDYDIDPNIIDPTCYDSTNATVTINNIPNPDNCSTYEIFQDTFSDIDSIDLTISRFVEAVKNDTGYVCGENAASDSTPDSIEGYGSYCPSGYTVNYTFKYDSSSHTPPRDSIRLVSQTEGHDDIVGFGKGLYEIQIENPLFSPHTFYAEVNHPPELLFGDIEVNTYSYNSEPEYNISQVNGTDTIKLTISGGTPGYHYELLDTNYNFLSEGIVDSLNSEYFITDVEAGNYYVKILDNNNCRSNPNSRFEELTAPMPVTIDSVLLNPVSCHINNEFETDNENENEDKHADGTAQIYIKNGIGPYKLKENTLTYTDLNVINDNVYSLTTGTLTARDYNFTIEDNYGNTRDTLITITSPPELGFTVDTIIPPACIGGNTGEIILKGFGGNDTYYIAESINGFNDSTEFNPADSTIQIYNLQSETYTLELEDSLECYYEDSIEIGENPLPVRISVIDSAEITCNSYNDGWVIVEGIQGDTLPGGYTFYLNNDIKGSGNALTINNLPPGWHSVAIADTNNCLNDDVIANEMFYTDSVWVYEPDTIRISKEIQPVSIKGTSTGKISFTISGGNEMFEYRFTDKNDSLLNSGTTDHQIVLDSLYAGDYFLMLKDTCNCTNGMGEWLTLNTITITEPDDFLGLTIDYIDTVKCLGGNDGAVILNAKGGNPPYTFGMDIHNIDSDNPEFTGLSSGSYTFYVKDSSDIIDSITQFVPENAKLVGGIGTKQDVSCYRGNNGFVSLNIEGGTPPYAYSVDNGENWIESFDIPALTAGNYRALVKDFYECTDTVPFTIDQPDILAVDSYSVQGAICGESNGSATIWMEGGTEPYQYFWHNQNNELISETNSIDNIPGGNYRVYVVDSSGCDTTINIIVDNTNGPAFSVTKTVPETCSGYNDGKVFFNISDTTGTLPFNLHAYYNNGEEPLFATSVQPTGADSLVGLSSGKYIFRLTDSIGCISTKQFTITSPASMSVELIERKDPVCYGYSDGIIEVTEEGGNGSYHYLWNDETSNSKITNLSAGNYQVTVSDSKGCFAEANYSLTDPEPLVVNLGEDIALCQGQLYPLSAGHFHTYHWYYNGNPLSTDSVITVSEQGKYSIRVEDESGCIATDSVLVTVSTDLLEADFLMASEAIVNDTIVIVDVSWPYPDDSEWILGPGIKSVSTEPYIDEITFESPGIYEVKLITELAMCIDSLTKSINVTRPDSENKESYKLGANEPLITQFNVFPNPNNGQFTIDAELSEVSGVEIRIYDVQHNSFVWIEQLHNSDKYLIEYNFNNLKSSVYLITIKARDERMAKRILITK